MWNLSDSVVVRRYLLLTILAKPCSHPRFTSVLCWCCCVAYSIFSVLLHHLHRSSLPGAADPGSVTAVTGITCSHTPLMANNLHRTLIYYLQCNIICDCTQQPLLILCHCYHWSCIILCCCCVFSVCCISLSPLSFNPPNPLHFIFMFSVFSGWPAIL